VSKVDCASEKALKTRFGLQSFPSFYIVDGWSVYQFENVRSEASLMDFARGGYKKQDVSVD
jgi:thioredoxin-like negative regulator of GroEL